MISLPGRHIVANLLLGAVLLSIVACSAPTAADMSSPPARDLPAVTDPGAGAGNGEPGTEPGGDPGTKPDEPVGNEPVNPVPPDQPSDGALHVQPRPNVVNPRPHAWDHISIGPDGRTMTVYYWGGVEDCYALAGVNVERDADGVLTVRVLEGQRGDIAPDTACIEIALLKAATIVLEDPIVAPVE